MITFNGRKPRWHVDNLVLTKSYGTGTVDVESRVQSGWTTWHVQAQKPHLWIVLTMDGELLAPAATVILLMLMFSVPELQNISVLLSLQT